MIKRKTLILVGTAIVCLLFSLWLSVWRFSQENIRNLLQDLPTVSFTGEQISTIGWDATEFGLLSVEENPAIEVRCDEPIYVQNLLIDGSIDRELTEVTVAYTETPDEPFTAENRFSAPVEVKNKDTYLRLERSVSALRLELCEDVGCELELEQIVLNPRRLNVNYQTLVLTFLLPFVVVLFLLELFGDRGGFRKTLSSVWKYRPLLCDLVTRDVKTKYRRSILGILWSILNPLLMMLVLTAVFANIFRYEIDDFPVYYLTGYILFNFVSEATNFSMSSIIGASGLIKKVYIPKIIFPLEKCLYALVNLLFSLIAAVIVFLIVGVTPQWTLLLFVVPIIYLFIFNFGLSLILATLNTFFRDVGYLYSVFITLWMYLTPIIYPISILPGWMQSIVRLNPLYHYVEYFRAVTLYGTVPSLSENLICLAYSLIFLLAGLLVFQKKQNKFIFYV